MEDEGHGEGEGEGRNEELEEDDDLPNDLNLDEAGNVSESRRLTRYISCISLVKIFCHQTASMQGGVVEGGILDFNVIK